MMFSSPGLPIMLSSSCHLILPKCSPHSLPWRALHPYILLHSLLQEIRNSTCLAKNPLPDFSKSLPEHMHDPTVSPCPRLISPPSHSFLPTVSPVDLPSQTLIHLSLFPLLLRRAGGAPALEPTCGSLDRLWRSTPDYLNLTK